MEIKYSTNSRSFSQKIFHLRLLSQQAEQIGNTKDKIRALFGLLRAYHSLDLAIRVFRKNLSLQREKNIDQKSDTWSKVFLERIKISLFEDTTRFQKTYSQRAEVKKQFFSELTKLRTQFRPWETEENKRLILLKESITSRNVSQSYFKMIKIELTAGRVLSARELVEKMLPGDWKNRALYLLKTGIERVGGGNFVKKRFIPSLKDLSTSNKYLPSLALFSQVLAQGVAGYPIAKKLLCKLQNPEKQEALAQFALVIYQTCSLLSAREFIQKISYKSAKNLARKLLLQHALQQGFEDDALSLVKDFSSLYAKHSAIAMLLRFYLNKNFLEKAECLRKQLTLPEFFAESLLLEAEIKIKKSHLGSARNKLNKIRKFLSTQDNDKPIFLHSGYNTSNFYQTLRAQLWKSFVAIDVYEKDKYISFDGLNLSERELQTFLFSPSIIRTLAESLYQANIPSQNFYDFGKNRLKEKLASHWIDFACKGFSTKDFLLNLSFIEEKNLPEKFSTEESFVLGALGWKQATSVREQNAFPEVVRSYYDEGLASSPCGKKRTKVLLRAARWKLRQAIDGTSKVPKDKALARLRSLSFLGGEKATQITGALFRESLKNPTYTKAIWNTLLSLSSQNALEYFFMQYYKVSTAGIYTSKLLLALEEKRALPIGYAKQFDQIRFSLHRYYERDFIELWLNTFLALWWKKFNKIIDPSFLVLMQKWLSESQQLPGFSPEGFWHPKKAAKDFLILLLQQKSRLLMNSPDSLVKKLCLVPENIERLRVFSPNTLETPLWSLSRWQRMFSQLDTHSGIVDRKLLFQFVRLLPGKQFSHAKIFSRLFLGKNPIKPPFWQEKFIGESEEILPKYRLRYLDKRQDILQFLRFADCVPCCFSSQRRHYFYWWHRNSSPWIRRLWKDPLSFCFQVFSLQKNTQDLPWGFVFGSFALYRTKPIVLLNGIYLKKQKESLRKAILYKIETQFCSPLGISHIVIANKYRGSGFLPRTYQRYPERTFYRLRALRQANGAMDQRIYDDISYRTNTQIQSRGQLYWKEISG